MGQASGSTIPVPPGRRGVLAERDLRVFRDARAAELTLAAVLGLSALSAKRGGVPDPRRWTTRSNGLIRVSDQPLRYALSQIGGS